MGSNETGSVAAEQVQEAKASADYDAGYRQAVHEVVGWLNLEMSEDGLRPGTGCVVSIRVMDRFPS